MSSSWSALPELPVPPIELPLAERAVLRDAARSERAAMRALERGGLNVVGEVLKGQGTFYEMTHYPADDVYDPDSHAQYYYHAHRGEEHGHFHTFLRQAAFPEGMAPADGFRRSEPLPPPQDQLAHLICISMDANGRPQGLFATNRWVTDESWYRAEDTLRLLEGYTIEHAYPNLAVNQWLTHLIRLCRPQIETLLRHRDQVVAAWQQRHPERDVLEDRSLEITGYLPLDVQQWIAQLEAPASAA